MTFLGGFCFLSLTSFLPLQDSTQGPNTFYYDLVKYAWIRWQSTSLWLISSFISLWSWSNAYNSWPPEHMLSDSEMLYYCMNSSGIIKSCETGESWWRFVWSFSLASRVVWLETFHVISVRLPIRNSKHVPRGLQAQWSPCSGILWTCVAGQPFFKPGKGKDRIAPAPPACA